MIMILNSILGTQNSEACWDPEMARVKHFLEEKYAADLSQKKKKHPTQKKCLP